MDQGSEKIKDAVGSILAEIKDCDDVEWMERFIGSTISVLKAAMAERFWRDHPEGGDLASEGVHRLRRGEVIRDWVFPFVEEKIGRRPENCVICYEVLAMCVNSNFAAQYAEAAPVLGKALSFLPREVFDDLVQADDLLFVLTVCAARGFLQSFPISGEFKPKGFMEMIHLDLAKAGESPVKTLLHEVVHWRRRDLHNATGLASMGWAPVQASKESAADYIATEWMAGRNPDLHSLPIDLMIDLSKGEKP